MQVDVTMKYMDELDKYRPSIGEVQDTFFLIIN